MVGVRKMEGLVDLHSHVLFGVDDGARTVDESSALLEGLLGLGFESVVATPHFDNCHLSPDVESQRRIISAIDEKRQGRGPALTTGAECVFDAAFIVQEKAGCIPKIGTADVYLVEFGFYPGGVPIGVEDILLRLAAEGRTFMLAHPERLSDLQTSRGRIETLIRAGMLMQLDVMSIVGRYGRNAERVARDMLKSSLYTVAATDIHREDDLEGVQEALAALHDIDENSFVRLFSTNPGLILQGRAKELRTPPTELRRNE
jgi:protein-tyrosine phosphatase